MLQAESIRQMTTMAEAFGKVGISISHWQLHDHHTRKAEYGHEAQVWTRRWHIERANAEAHLRAVPSQSGQHS